MSRTAVADGARRCWVDIENPPQVQYLVPLARAIGERGFEPTFTARDFSITLELLRRRGIDYTAVGPVPGRGKATKVLALGVRGWKLRRITRPLAPTLCLGGGRSHAIVAASMRIRPFTICDYEYVDLRVARAARSWIFIPDVIDPALLSSKGIAPDSIVPFPGLKEHMSFAGFDVSSVVPDPLPELGSVDRAVPRALFRPPGESTHYYEQASGDLAREALRRLARRDDVVVVFVRRTAGQEAYLEGLPWVNDPVVLERAVDFISLLKAVDAVISSGGTMLREAAYLGVPAYSIFRSALGSVDRHLASIGRLTLVEEGAQLADATFVRSDALDPLPAPSDDPLGEVASAMVARVDA